jgi:hypothetical protein
MAKIMTKENGIWYELWSKESHRGENLITPHLMSYSFKFLLEAAYHQYEQQKLNRLYIEKHNSNKWMRNIKPNVWYFFLDFLSGTTKPQWNVNGIINMIKIIDKIGVKLI